MTGKSYEWNPLKRLSENNQPHHELHIPMVYEQVESEPARWEYRVLSVDLSEEEPPSVEMLNELGGQGWLLVSAVTQTTRRTIAHYYFVRQLRG